MADITTELDLYIEEGRLTKLVAETKAAAQANPSDEAARDAFNAAKLEHRAFKAEWRAVRRAAQDAAIATGDPAALAAFVGNGDAIAAPAPLETGLTAQEG